MENGASAGRFYLSAITRIGSDEQDYRRQLLHRRVYMWVGTGVQLSAA
jgi:hypothetical protein